MPTPKEVGLRCWWATVLMFLIFPFCQAARVYYLWQTHHTRHSSLLLLLSVNLPTVLTTVHRQRSSLWPLTSSVSLTKVWFWLILLDSLVNLLCFVLGNQVSILPTSFGGWYTPRCLPFALLAKESSPPSAAWLKLKNFHLLLFNKWICCCNAFRLISLKHNYKGLFF